jgi:monofunctional biosynthetic peptidoglycan transglycosylase
VACYLLAVLLLLVLRWIDPPTTSVQIERRVQSLFSREPYQKHYFFVPLARISAGFQHAVIAAEDARFFDHHGFDWRQVQIAAEDMEREKRARGASTIDQQLVKNLLLTDSRTLVRKAVEATLVPPAEVVLGKRRILELYMNVAEWGPGVYGAEAAARYYYRVPAAAITREQGIRLAALLPAPRHRKPATVGVYSSKIAERMRQMGW